MLSKSDISSALKTSRIIIYATTISVYFYSRFFFNRDTLCNHGYTCPFCGLRTAMFYFERGKFLDAFNSNKLFILIVAFFIIAFLDCICMFISYLRNKKT